MLEKLGEVLRKATNKVANAIFLDKDLVDSIIRDLQRALIEADVNIHLVKQLSDKIKKSALDERIKASATSNYIIGFRRLLESIGPQDAEQNIYKEILIKLEQLWVLLADF